MEVTKETSVNYFKSLFVFEGRRGRKSYVLATLTLIGLGILGVIVGTILTLLSGFLGLLFMVPYFLLIAVGTWTTAAQRFRDFGQSGCWAFLFLVPYVGFAVGLALYFIPPNPGLNKYGEQP
jgi:uncharacterized membrane protein YhaH (DUF805 family)